MCIRDRIDIMVYSSGVNVPDRALTRLRRETWDRVISVNLNGCLLYTSRCV